MFQQLERLKNKVGCHHALQGASLHSRCCPISGAVTGHPAVLMTAPSSIGSVVWYYFSSSVKSVGI